ncbi:MAG: kinase/pyrophosphorylase, partial [Finegoldia magna]|nr:kinase/pyrophosphorylase [Finegoldia magna]
LNKIRKERLKSMGLPTESTYSDLGRILDELDYAEKVMKKIGCPIINVSDRAIEETAEVIIRHLKKMND